MLVLFFNIKADQYYKYCFYKFTIYYTPLNSLTLVHFIWCILQAWARLLKNVIDYIVEFCVIDY